MAVDHLVVHPPVLRLTIISIVPLGFLAHKVVQNLWVMVVLIGVREVDGGLVVIISKLLLIMKLSEPPLNFSNQWPRVILFIFHFSTISF